MDTLVAIVFVAVISAVTGFNLDVAFPIVYTDPDARSNRSTYFGYSVVLHEELLPGVSWIQIGAPKANSSTAQVKQPGKVYRCNLFKPCDHLQMFTSNVESSWSGGSMDIDENAGRTVVCSHRWIKYMSTDNWMEGVCQWAHVNDTFSRNLKPLDNNAKGIYSDKTTGTSLYNYAQGQAGFSTHFSHSKHESELLLGAPGVYNWDGTMIRYRDGSDAPPIASKLSAQLQTPTKRDVGYAAFTDLNIADAWNTRETASFGLFGYSITSGYFFDKNDLWYVSGAPRSHTCIGQILVFKFSSYNDRPLVVKIQLQGYQNGEYFGASLTAGDINQDGLDDLVVGAPFYSSGKYNEGRIFVFLGNSKGNLETPQQNPIIEGKMIGGQFGTSIMFLGDLHQDGYGDVAVGAPYENEGSGSIYIFRGNALGLDFEPCQRIVGTSIIPTIKGFGISISKATDVDGNFFNDLAVGAYLSGHVVVFRGKPIVTLKQSLKSVTSQLDHTTRMFQVNACVLYSGNNIPPFINVTRKIAVDETLHRANLPRDTLAVYNMTLQGNRITCENITINVKKDIHDRYTPITITTSYGLVTENLPPTVLYVDHNKRVTQQDKFCRLCPVLNTYKSVTEETLAVSFTLGCGSDNICETKLDLESRFLNIKNNDIYVLGSSNYLQLETTISNSGENAYLTQLVVELPRSVYFRSIPTNCLEQNTSSIIICNIENPLEEYKQKIIVLDLDMKEVNSEKYGDQLIFTQKLLTSSVNSNKNVFSKILNVVREADVALTGKSSQQSYSYENITNGMPTFIQTYRVEKFGVSPIEEVNLTVLVPTQIYGMQLINFAYLYKPEGNHAGQPIKCDSNVQYIVDEQANTEAQIGPIADRSEYTANNDTKTYTPIKSKRSIDETSEAGVENELEYPSNRTLYINCSNPDVICSRINCSIGPLKTKQNIAVLQIKARLDVPSISELLGIKNVIILSTDGMVTIKNPADFVQNGKRPDFTRISSVFIGDMPESKVEMWIIIVAIIAGLLLLLLLIMGLVKAGFFRRTKKQELQALKEAEVAEEFSPGPEGDVSYEVTDKDCSENEHLEENSLYDKQ